MSETPFSRIENRSYDTSAQHHTPGVFWEHAPPADSPKRTSIGKRVEMNPEPVDTDMQERAERWVSTMKGTAIIPGVTVAHADSWAGPGQTRIIGRQERENVENQTLSRLATRSQGGGNRSLPEEPDDWRTCFERDRDRILHSAAFRRLAGKTQVFIFPDDHQRTRLTHALEVAQVATAIARPLGLNVTLTDAIALGHDCGHGPGGHASEDALSPLVDGGFDHAAWGADVTLTPLNLCHETLDGIRNHSWSRPAPSTPEGEVVSWADRIAYVCHDFEDAVSAGIVTPDQLPADVIKLCGLQRTSQLQAFITSMISAAHSSGRIGMESDHAHALASFRQFNYDRVYLREASKRQASQVIVLLRALVEHYFNHPHRLPSGDQYDVGSAESHHAAVAYVAGMTDRFACRQAVSLLGWSENQLPTGIDVAV